MKSFFLLVFLAPAACVRKECEKPMVVVLKDCDEARRREVMEKCLTGYGSPGPDTIRNCDDAAIKVSCKHETIANPNFCGK